MGADSVFLPLVNRLLLRPRLRSAAVSEKANARACAELLAAKEKTGMLSSIC